MRLSVVIQRNQTKGLPKSSSADRTKDKKFGGIEQYRRLLGQWHDSKCFLFLYYCLFSVNSSGAAVVNCHSWLTVLWIEEESVVRFFRLPIRFLKSHFELLSGSIIRLLDRSSPAPYSGEESGTDDDGEKKRSKKFPIFRPEIDGEMSRFVCGLIFERKKHLADVIIEHKVNKDVDVSEFIEKVYRELNYNITRRIYHKIKKKAMELLERKYMDQNGRLCNV
ncbi:hypothetical protein M9H77_11923 [Catharanthus roseus]|uniref:Uncharacterized protein n=1 Tax=Catharanthus roseus TaxID=4058 RepID=A0ACC0BG10_CATRO|nr:hypothetical protein M9H77_11923 [Catharanthus roseus]